MAAVNQPTTEVTQPPVQAPVVASAAPSVDTPPARPEYADPVESPVKDTPVEPADDGELPGTEARQSEIVDPEGELEELEDRSMPVERVLWAINREGRRVEQTYVQQSLSWFGKLELYGILGQAVKVVLEGDNPLGINTIMDTIQNPRGVITDLLGSMPGADSIPDRPEISEEMELEAGKILAAFAQVAAMAPDLLASAYCVALAIPKTHRNWAIEWAFPNMDDEMGKDILHVFIDQNWGVMEDFFTQELRTIVKRIVKARKDSAGRR